MTSTRQINQAGCAGQDGSILITANPAPGNVTPMLAIASHLQKQGYPILFNTAEAFRQQVESEGLCFVPLVGRASLDYCSFSKIPPAGQPLTQGLEEMIHNVRHVMGGAMLPQYDGVCEILSREPVSLILTDSMFYGIFPLLLGPWMERPPVISVSTSPMVLASIDASPFAPAVTIKEKECNREESTRFQAGLAWVNDYLDHLLHNRGCRSLPRFFLDCIYTLPDLLLQLSAQSLEFPRSDMPDHIKFVGPVLPKPALDFQPPEWWKELDSSRPVVLVTQGTAANTDLNQLIGPTLAGLASEDVTVIAATGKPAHTFTVPVPSNAKVTPFIPFMEILHKVDVFVTSGGYGGVNQALSMGVPIVVAGGSGDHALVAARVAWTGAGISLGTSRPGPEHIRSAVREILRDPAYHAKARLLYHEFTQYDALESIRCCVDSFLGYPTAIETVYEHSNA